MTDEIAKGIRLLPGDMREVLQSLEPDSVDSCVCDPPYHFASIVKRFGKEGSAPAQFGKDGAFSRASKGFMGKEWDGGEIAFEPETWAAVYRVLKPGAHLLAFGAPKNFGFMQYAIAQAGFEVRDVLAWIFGSGFPKSHNIGNGWGTALKPAYEPIIMARKPLIGTVAKNVAEHGTGAINVDACRISTGENLNGGAYAINGSRKPIAGDERTGAALGMFQPGKTAEKDYEQPHGRWPANVVHDGSLEVLAAFPDADGPGGPAKRESIGTGDGITYMAQKPQGSIYAGETGSAARFFYTAKADADDRLGCKHPTVKPVDLMQWLVRLVTPKGGLVLDPFAGTGTTGEAAFREGMRAILIEREPEYQADIRRRMQLVLSGPDERRRATIKEKTKDAPADHGPLFAEAAE